MHFNPERHTLTHAIKEVQAELFSDLFSRSAGLPQSKKSFEYINSYIMQHDIEARSDKTNMSYVLNDNIDFSNKAVGFVLSIINSSNEKNEETLEKINNVWKEKPVFMSACKLKEKETQLERSYQNTRTDMFDNEKMKSSKE